MIPLRLCALLLAAVLTGCAAPAPAVSADPAMVPTTAGPVRGVVAGDGVRIFRGVPYAAAPVGEMRWQPPAAPVPWDAVRDATRPGLRCVQDTRIDPDYGLPTGEDCLNLTVWSPAGATPTRPRPVMVWIHGGGFLNGSSDIYDARRLAGRGDIVVVTVNYRLGALGFLAHPALPGEPGNYGLADQQAALRWVRDNIARFGGDPGRVSIAGESAGAMSVCDHLVAPESAGLFAGAILQSGPCQAQADLPAARAVSLDYAAGAGCADPATARDCLLGLPPDRLTGGPAYFRIGTSRLSGPVTGTPRLPVAPPTVAARGPIARVPVLIGSTADEFSVFVAVSYLQQRSLPPYRTMLSDAFGAHAPAVAARYPPGGYDGNAGAAYAAAVTDGVFACPADALAGALADAGARGAPVYAYEFADRTAPVPEPLLAAPIPTGAGHGLELRYLFDMGGTPPLNPAQRTLSDQMIDYWARFVATGAPDVEGLPSWPPLDPRNPRRMSLQTGAPTLTDDFAARHRCDFWAALG